MTKRRNVETEAMVSASSESLLEEVISNSAGKVQRRRYSYDRAVNNGGLPVVGECIEIEKPQDTKGRVRVAWDAGMGVQKEWLSFLRGTEIQKHDQVLLQYIRNGMLPIVIGVLASDSDSGEQHVALETADKRLVLAPKESMQVVAENGQPLLTIAHTEDGAVVKLLGHQSNIDLSGNALRIAAGSIELKADKGNIDITSEENVVVLGREIHLN